MWARSLAHIYHGTILRWSLNFVGPLVVTPRRAKYVLVMMEHFSRLIEFVALPQNSTKLAAAAYLDRVLARFGAPAEVLADQGREFLGAFKKLCIKALIDHRTTSRDHSEADGLAERFVQTTKRGLGATRIGTLCCLGLLWAIDLVGMVFWHPTTHSNCCMDLYSRVLIGKS